MRRSCHYCDWTGESEATHCPKCFRWLAESVSESIRNRRDWPDAPRVTAFRSGWFEHIAEQPIYISSKQQLRAECAKHGCISHYLEF